MIIFVNGRFVSEQETSSCWSDRGFLYGDGLFETLLIRQGRLFAWKEHWDRLEAGLKRLALPCAYSPDEIDSFSRRLCGENNLSEAVLRLTISRGPGGRGYSPPRDSSPTFVLKLYPSPVVSPTEPVRWRVRSSSFPLWSGDPLAGFKTANKLPQVLARMEAEDAGGDEALLFNEKDEVVESASGNVFFIRNQSLVTPSLKCGALPGVTRQQILGIARERGMSVKEGSIPRQDLQGMEGGLITMSTLGVVEISELDGKPFLSNQKVIELHQDWQRSVEEGCRENSDPGQ